jgi:myosin heavy subunit
LGAFHLPTDVFNPSPPPYPPAAQAPLLHLLCARFQQDKIYTNVGGVLISVNPYKLIPKLYSLKAPGEASSAAAAASAESDTSLAAVESGGPHVYLIAQQALEVLGT